jgi:hypothetical protein
MVWLHGASVDGMDLRAFRSLLIAAVAIGGGSIVIASAIKARTDAPPVSTVHKWVRASAVQPASIRWSAKFNFASASFGRSCGANGRSRSSANMREYT